jgi:hypothetical protein
MHATEGFVLNLASQMMIATALVMSIVTVDYVKPENQLSLSVGKTNNVNIIAVM